VFLALLDERAVRHPGAVAPQRRHAIDGRGGAPGGEQAGGPSAAFAAVVAEATSGWRGRARSRAGSFDGDNGR
jgi:hypothetical protein